jgi:hypothetical protein
MKDIEASYLIYFLSLYSSSVNSVSLWLIKIDILVWQSDSICEK